MSKFVLMLLGFMLAGSYTSVILAEGNAQKGKSLTGACTVCHGEDGNSLNGSFPSLAEQGEKYLLKQMKDINSGARSAPLMAGLLDGFSKSDIADIAAYYASQKVTIGAAKKELVELGETIYRAGIARKKVAACTACHSPSGQGNELAAFPALGGQWPEYTLAQLKAFRDGARTNDGDGRMMQGVARDMSDKEMKAVASYIRGLSN